MKIIKTTLPHIVKIKDPIELAELIAQIVKYDFALKNNYRDESFEAYCIINYDFSLMLATMNSQ